MNFTHLHVHTEYSLLDGSSKIGEITKRAKELGMDSLAITDHYNTDVFAFGDSDVRKLLADIQVEEQNHAEMLYKYKTVNGMA